eukprot:2999225-Rhodomonas_salina.2
MSQTRVESEPTAQILRCVPAGPCTPSSHMSSSPSASSSCRSAECSFFRRLGPDRTSMSLFQPDCLDSSLLSVLTTLSTPACGMTLDMQEQACEVVERDSAQPQPALLVRNQLRVPRQSVRLQHTGTEE